MHMSIEDLENMGRDLMRTLLVYSEIYFPPDLQNIQQVMQPKHVSDLDKKQL
jgi:hypothetical protein